MYVYVHTNKINGKRYVGQTHDVNERWACNGIRYKKQMFGKAIEKYGWENFSHRYLEVPDEEVNAVEQILIDYWHTTDPRYGYNLTPGGSAPTGPEVWKKISESLKGRTFSEEHKKHISESKKGQGLGVKNPAKGRKGEENGRSKKIKCVETGEVFGCIRDAQQWLLETKGVKGAVGRSLKTGKKAGGYHWQEL